MSGIQQGLLASFSSVEEFYLYAWGRNFITPYNDGRLGDGTAISKSSPVQVGALTDWAQVSAGARHTGSVKTDGTLWTWGFGPYGRLGHGSSGSYASRSSPVQVGALTNWAQVAAGAEHTACVKTDGTLWTWGRNSNRQLGQGESYQHRSSPAQLGALTNWAQVACGGSHTLCVKTDSTLWSWGFNQLGQLGNLPSGQATGSSPVQVGALTNWAQVACGDLHTLCVKTDSTLWAWGGGLNGKLGDNTTIDKSSPVQVGALALWKQVSAGWRHTACVRTDGRLFIWGYGGNGQGGAGNIFGTNSPRQVGSLAIWNQVSAGARHCAGIRTDGRLFTWGGNNGGELGDGTTANKSSPVQVGALTKWLQVSAGAISNGDGHTVAIFKS